MSTPNYDTVRAAMDEAKQTLDRADAVAESLARMLDGRLHKVRDSALLCRLKKQLQNYNMQTGRWNNNQS